MGSSNNFVPGKGLSMLLCKCPQCRSGNMFKYPATDIKRFMQMHEFCPVCKLRFEIEPGFFWGAMYVSYALTTGLMLITCGILLWVFNDPDLWVYMVCIIAAVFLLLPWTFRFSRMLMLYLFSPVRFNKDLARGTNN
jgi:uncharacterized protein (DUF983 family)